MYASDPIVSGKGRKARGDGGKEKGRNEGIFIRLYRPCVASCSKRGSLGSSPSGEVE